MAKKRNKHAGSKGAIFIEAAVGLPIVIFILFATYYIIVRPFLEKQDLVEIGSNAILYAYDGPNADYIKDLRDQVRALALIENIKLNDNATVVCPQTNLACGCTFSYLDSVATPASDTLGCLNSNIQTYFHITIVNDRDTKVEVLGYKKF